MARKISAPSGRFNVSTIVSLAEGGRLNDAVSMFRKTLASHAYVFDASVILEIVELHKCGMDEAAHLLFDSRINFYMVKFSLDRLLEYNAWINEIHAIGFRDKARDMFRRLTADDAASRAVSDMLYDLQLRVYVSEGAQRELAERDNDLVSVLRRLADDEENRLLDSECESANSFKTFKTI